MTLNIGGGLEGIQSLLAEVASQRAAQHAHALEQQNQISSIIGTLKKMPAGTRSVLGGVTSNGGGGGGGTLVTPKGNVKGWISNALKVLGLDDSYAAGIATMIKHESGGNPNAINKWDSNWKKGTPSKGLMQTIDPTFRRWHVKGTADNVYDPVANIAAGVNYALHRYGPDMVKQGGRRKQGKYVGY